MAQERQNMGDRRKWSSWVFMVTLFVGRYPLVSTHFYSEYYISLPHKTCLVIADVLFFITADPPTEMEKAKTKVLVGRKPQALRTAFHLVYKGFRQEFDSIFRNWLRQVCA